MIAFTAYSAVQTPNALKLAGRVPKIAHSPGDFDTHHQRHFDRFKCFAQHVRVTNTPTDTHRHVMCDICSNRLHLFNACDMI